LRGERDSDEELKTERRFIMSIDRVEIENFLVFKEKFSLDFCPGVNFIIGENGSGKTTILKGLYAFSNASAFANLIEKAPVDDKIKYSSIPLDESIIYYCFRQQALDWNDEVSDEFDNDRLYRSFFQFIIYYNNTKYGIDNTKKDDYYFRYIPTKKCLFIPSIDMLSHSKNLIELNDKYFLPFDQTLIDILYAAGLPSLREKNKEFEKIQKIIEEIIGGTVLYDGKQYYIKKTDGETIEYSFEAEGLRKFGLIWQLINNGSIEPGSVIFWDEPENSLNPKLMEALAEIILEFSRHNIQFFIASHSEILARFIALKKAENDSLLFHALKKNGNKIENDTKKSYNALDFNYLSSVRGDLYEKEVSKELSDD
jgi:AAA15 family ATPase/GTPase